MDTQSKTIRFPKDTYERLRKVAFDLKVPQNTIVVAKLQDWLDSPCPDCGNPVGTFHDDVCDMAVCPTTGRQKLVCHGSDGHDCGNVTWKGWGTDA